MLPPQPAGLDPPRPTPRQRWIAAQRLAAGDSPARAVTHAGIPRSALLPLLDDPDFLALQAEESSLLALPPEEWAERTAVEARQTAARALADGKVSTVNLLLRTSIALP